MVCIPPETGLLIPFLPGARHDSPGHAAIEQTFSTASHSGQ